MRIVWHELKIYYYNLGILNLRTDLYELQDFTFGSVGLIEFIFELSDCIFVNCIFLIVFPYFCQLFIKITTDGFIYLAVQPYIKCLIHYSSRCIYCVYEAKLDIMYNTHFFSVDTLHLIMYIDTLHVQIPL